MPVPTSAGFLVRALTKPAARAKGSATARAHLPRSSGGATGTVCRRSPAEAQQRQAQGIDAHAASVHEWSRLTGASEHAPDGHLPHQGRAAPSTGLGVGRSGQAVLLVARRSTPGRAVPADPWSRLHVSGFCAFLPPKREPRALSSARREDRDGAPGAGADGEGQGAETRIAHRPPSSGAELVLMLRWSAAFRHAVPLRQAFPVPGGEVGGREQVVGCRWSFISHGSVPGLTPGSRHRRSVPVPVPPLPRRLLKKARDAGRSVL